jgi:hypothetical protein
LSQSNGNSTGASIAAQLQMLAGTGLSPDQIAVNVYEALSVLSSQLNTLYNILFSASPQLQDLQIDSADIETLTVGGASGPGQLNVDGGPPGYPSVGWVGSNPTSSAPTIALSNVTAGLATTGSNHGLSPNQIILQAGTSNQAHNGYFVVASTPTPTTYTATGLTGNSTGGSVQRQFVGGWMKTFAIGGSSFFDALTNGIYADENGNVFISGTLKAASIVAAALNITGILVDGLTLTNNSPTSGNVAWSACTVYYKGTAYAISAGNTTGGNKLVYWTVGGSTFSSANSFTPGPTVFTIATNNAGASDTAWNKVGAVSVQAANLSFGLLGFSLQNPASAAVNVGTGGSTTVLSSSPANGGVVVSVGIDLTGLHNAVLSSTNALAVQLNITADGMSAGSIPVYNFSNTAVGDPPLLRSLLTLGVANAGSTAALPYLNIPLNLGFASSISIVAVVTGPSNIGSAVMEVYVNWMTKN